MPFGYDDNTSSAVDSETGSIVKRGHSMPDHRPRANSPHYIFEYKQTCLNLFPIDRCKPVKWTSPKTGEIENLAYPRITYVVESEIAEELKFLQEKMGVSREQLKKIIENGIYACATKGGKFPSLLDMVPDYEVKIVQNNGQIPAKDYFYSANQ